MLRRNPVLAKSDKLITKINSDIGAQFFSYLLLILIFVHT